MIQGRFRFYLIIGSTGVFLILVHLYLSTIIIDVGDKNTTLKIELDQLQNQNRILGATWEERVDFNVLEKKAKELGYFSPEKVFYLLLPTSEADTP